MTTMKLGRFGATALLCLSAAGSQADDEHIDAALSDALLRAVGLWQTLELDTTPTLEGGPADQTAKVGSLISNMARSPVASERVAALEGIQSLDVPEAIALLVQGLFDADQSVREEAANGLLAYPDEEAVERGLRGRLLTADSSDLERVHHTLSRLGDLADDITSVLEDETTPIETATRAAICIGYLGASDAGGTLGKRAWTRDRDLAVASTWALASLADGRWLNQLAELTRHPLPDVRNQACRGLALVGGADALNVLADVAVTPVEPTLEVRRNAVYFIAEANEPASVDALMGVMARAPRLQGEAAVALQRLTRLPFSGGRLVVEEWYRAWRANPVWPIPAFTETADPLIISAQ